MAESAHLSEERSFTSPETRASLDRLLKRTTR